MSIKQDYSEYLRQPGMLELIEGSWTTECNDMHSSFASSVNDTIKKFNLKTVVEVGCGTGEVAKRIIADMYYGIDQNERCIRLAMLKNTEQEKKIFIVGDVRQVDLTPIKDIVCAFSVLKHFGLHEWIRVFRKICSLGTFVIFSIPISEATFDDGTEFHHVWWNKELLMQVIEMHNLSVIEERYENPIEPIFICRRKDV